MRLCDGTSDDCTRFATTTRDTSDGYCPVEHYCTSCATAYDDWRANYEPPEPDGEAFRGGEAAAFQREQCDAAWRLK